MNQRWAGGDASGLRFPADPAALADSGTAFLTEAFHASGVLAPGNAVTRVSRLKEVSGGSTGRKALLDVEYLTADTGLHEQLFVKFSRDFDDPVRDHGKSQMAAEVLFAELSRSPGFPIAVPATQFADYHRATGTGILITERIAFDHNGIEPQHHKGLDYRMPRPFEHYRALVTALARLVGAHRSGRLPADLVARFPVDLRAATVGEAPPMNPDKLDRRVGRLVDFLESHHGLAPPALRDPAFLARIGDDARRILESEDMIWRRLADAQDHIALCHWNANVDNAWFWADGDDLRCGLMDWGCVSQLNVAMALWGALSAAESTLWDDHFDELLQLFCAEVLACGGPSLAPDDLARDVVLYAVLMGITWLLDVPSLIRARVPGSGPSTRRTDPGIEEHEGVRAPLLMLLNVLNLWATRDPAAMLDRMGG